MVHELRPDIPWDKGRAVLWLLERMETGEAAPVYVGDDETDRDAFRALAGRGVSVLVSATPQPEAGADYRLRDPGETRRLLEALARLAEGAPA
jgi:trehalose-phosphatase